MSERQSEKQELLPIDLPFPNFHWSELILNAFILKSEFIKVNLLFIVDIIEMWLSYSVLKHNSVDILKNWLKKVSTNRC